jgi:hypothetical protein
LARECEIESFAVLPSVKTKCRLCTISGGNHGIDHAASVVLDDKASLSNSSAHRTGGRLLWISIGEVRGSTLFRQLRDVGSQPFKRE